MFKNQRELSFQHHEVNDYDREIVLQTERCSMDG